jgi:hypothetical protein
MPLASTFALQWYGNCCAAMVIGAASGVEAFNAKRSVRAGISITGIGTVHVFRPYRARYAALVCNGIGVLHVAAPKRRIRAGLSVSVNDLTKDDVTGAVLEGKVEGDLTLKQALRQLLAVAQGNATGLGGPDIAYKSMDGSVTRVAGTVVAGTRTITARNPD